MSSPDDDLAKFARGLSGDWTAGGYGRIGYDIYSSRQKAASAPETPRVWAPLSSDQGSSSFTRKARARRAAEEKPYIPRPWATGLIKKISPGLPLVCAGVAALYSGYHIYMWVMNVLSPDEFGAYFFTGGLGLTIVVFIARLAYLLPEFVISLADMFYQVRYVLAGMALTGAALWASWQYLL